MISELDVIEAGCVGMKIGPVGNVYRSGDMLTGFRQVLVGVHNFKTEFFAEIPRFIVAIRSGIAVITIECLGKSLPGNVGTDKCLGHRFTSSVGGEGVW